MAERGAISGYYFTLFAFVGVQLPFWPLWLAGRGLTAAEIGLLLSAVTWGAVISNPLIARATDRRGRAKLVMAAALSVALAIYAGLLAATGYSSILPLALFAGLAGAAVHPLGESLILRRVHERGYDYGRLRLWGSVSFIAASLIMGLLVSRLGADAVLPAMIVCLAATLIAIAGLPGRPKQTNVATSRPIRALLANRVFILFLVTAALIQASHGAYYGFASLHWRAQGLSGHWIGALWAEGVVAEIVLFAFSRRLLRRFGVVGLLGLGGAAAAVRWIAMAATADPLLLVAVQLLHGFTFGATHLGAMHFLSRAAPEGAAATAQSLYAGASSGIAMGASLWFSGLLFAQSPAAAFAAMSVLALAGAVCAFALVRRWDGGRLRL